MKNFKLSKKDVVFAFIDIQDRLLKAISNNDEVVKNAKVLAKIANMLELESLFTVQYPHGLGYTNREVKAPLDEKTEFPKLYFSAYDDKEINSEIKKLKKRQFIVCGIESHICVLQTVRSLLSSGYEVFLVEDAVGSRNGNNSKNAIEQMREMGAVITNTESVLFDLAEVAGTDEFKALQKLII